MPFFPFLLQKRTPLLGIDITASTLKLLELSQINDTYRIESVAIVPLPNETMIDNEIQNSLAITEATREAIKISGTSLRKAAIAIPESLVMTKIIQLNAALNDRDRENIIMSEVDKYIPYCIEDINLDFQILSPSKQNAQFLDILLVASHKHNIEGRVNAINASGLFVDIVDIESYAVVRACQLSLKKINIKNTVIGIIYSRFPTMTFNVLQNELIIFSHTENYDRQLLIDIIKPNQEFTHFDTSHERVLIFLQHCLQLFDSNNQFITINHLFFTGEISKSDGFKDYVKQKFHSELIITNPFNQIVFSPSIDKEMLENNLPSLLISCGLALRSFEWQ